MQFSYPNFVLKSYLCLKLWKESHWRSDDPALLGQEGLNQLAKGSKIVIYEIPNHDVDGRKFCKAVLFENHTDKKFLTF